MKRDKSKLSLNVETLRSLSATDLLTVQGGQGEQHAAAAASNKILCTVSQGSCICSFGCRPV